MTPESLALHAKAQAELYKLMSSLSPDQCSAIALVVVRWYHEGTLAERARLKARIESLTRGERNG